MHVAILGLGPSIDAYVRLTRQSGGRRCCYDEVWAVNALGDVLHCDRIFHMDDVRIQEIRAAARPESNIARMLDWMRTHPGPIVTSRAHPDYPGLEEFPLAEVLTMWPQGYFNSTAAYAVAYALHVGVSKLSVYGCDYTYPNSHQAEKGRACMEFWLGIAAARGVQLAVPRVTSLLDAMYSQGERFYGYDSEDLAFSRIGDRVEVARTPRAALPTADEIEARYDHAAHPNPLMIEVSS